MALLPRHRGRTGHVHDHRLPRSWTVLTKYEIGQTGIPFIMVGYLVLFAAFVYLLNFTPFGRASTPSA